MAAIAHAVATNAPNPRNSFMSGTVAPESCPAISKRRIPITRVTAAQCSANRSRRTCANAGPKSIDGQPLRRAAAYSDSARRGTTVDARVVRWTGAPPGAGIAERPRCAGRAARTLDALRQVRAAEFPQRARAAEPRRHALRFRAHRPAAYRQGLHRPPPPLSLV